MEVKLLSQSIIIIFILVLIIVLLCFGLSGFINSPGRDESGSNYIHFNDYTALAFKDKLWIYGGYFSITYGGGWGPDKVSVRYSFHTKSSLDGLYWETLNSAPWSPRCAHVTLEFKGKVWLMGGYKTSGDQERHYQNDVWNSTDGEHWKPVTEKAGWEPRAYQTGVVFRDQIWLFGGHDRKTEYIDVWRSKDGSVWEKVSDSGPGFLNQVRPTNVKAIVFNNQIWVKEQFEDCFWCSDDGLKWKKIIPVHHNARFDDEQFALAVYMDKFWYIHRGGTWSSSDGINWNKTGYNRDEINWQINSCVFKDRLWILGNKVFTIDKETKKMFKEDCFYTIDGSFWNHPFARKQSTAGWEQLDDNISGIIYENKIWLFTVGIWQTINGRNWRLVSDESVFRYSCFVFNNKIWQLRGKEEGIYSTTNGIEWRKEADHSFENVEYGKAVLFNNQIYFIEYQDYVSDKDRFVDDNNTSWRSVCRVWRSIDGVHWKMIKKNPWVPRQGFSLNVFNGMLWLIGGTGSEIISDKKSTWSRHHDFNDVWHSADGVNWIKVNAPIPWQGRSYHSSIVFNDKLWIIGGAVDAQTGSRDILCDVWYTEDGSHWNRVTDSVVLETYSGNLGMEFQSKMWLIGWGRALWSTDGVNWTDATYIKKPCAEIYEK